MPFFGDQRFLVTRIENFSGCQRLHECIDGWNIVAGCRRVSAAAWSVLLWRFDMEIDLPAALSRAASNAGIIMLLGRVAHSVFATDDVI